MSAPRDISPEDMREIMTDHHRGRGKSEEWIAGYIAAMDEAGYSNPRKPAWIRNSAALKFLLPKPTR